MSGDAVHGAIRQDNEMINKVSFNDKASVGVERPRAPEADIFHPRGKFHIQHIRDGVILQEFDVDNGITNGGKDSLLNVYFNSASQITTWYVGLVDNASFSAFAAADTISSHAGWIENQDYDEATRVSWGSGSSSGQSITNATADTFTMSATKTIKGIFLNSVSTKGGTTGTLWSTAAFGSTVSVNDNDLLKVTYTVSC